MNLFSIISLCSILLLANKEPAFHETTIYARTSKDSLPPLPPAPIINRGWIGQFTYTIKLQGTGNQPKPYSYHVKFNRVHTGYVVLTRELKSAIRVNQPDKYNAQRWESWVSEGRKKSWNYVNDSLHEVTVITSDACCRTPHDHFRTTQAGGRSQWKEGNLHNYDLQIDYETGAYILSMPLIQLDAETKEIWKVNKAAADQNKYIRDVNETLTEKFQTYGYFNPMDTIMGKMRRGQTEIIIKRTAMIHYTDLLWQDAKTGKPVYITPASKGSVEFSLSLKRVGDK